MPVELTPISGVAAMTIAEARTWVRDFARNAGDSSEYSDARIDRAIQFVCSRFVDKTKCTRTTSNLTIADGVSTGSVSASGFRAEYVLKAWIPAEGELSMIEHANLLDKQLACARTALPGFISFTSPTAFEVYPTPDDDYTGKILWSEPFVSWTPGSGSPSFNIPDECLKQILTFGVPAACQHNEVEHLYASESWKKYLEFELSKKGSGHFGAKQYIRTLPT